MDQIIEIKMKLIDDLNLLCLTVSQWERLSLEMGINPLDIFGVSFNNLEKGQALVDRVIQLGRHNSLIETAKRVCHQYVSSFDEVQGNRPRIGRLDNKIAIKLGELYKELLLKLDESEINETDKNASDEETKDFTEFKEKLREKAKFSPSNRILAIESKNENTVLKRKAKKLGYSKYEEINKKIRSYYNMRILVNYPPDRFNADQRLSFLVNELFEFLPEELQEEEAIDYLYGLIFDTTFKCYIFNE
ncbi:hypothetical protein COK34_06965 [Bacillus thuringiensis]|uniref:hypothetical protein n=1 Tax=Bacillus thuringiensis TaxID=1428 RepID=UPI000BF72DC5|nr:hypothetical protein [Bacillus thuringiensis]PFD66894.1 hypothetical protein CN309_08485 [Bacillus thuringiensis]PFO46537.1 hypothetical protein COJ84_01350 [Bacillus thuringiensis]PFR56349.1 hypothetical protein COK34_06965 [Bacillus thuringiensis]